MTKFIDALSARRTIYHLGKNVSIASDELSELIFQTVELSPSAFNSQSSRIVVLFDEAHTYLWDKIVRETLRKAVGDGDFTSTSNKMDSFKNAFGTVLFFEDNEVIKSLQAQYALYADKFEHFSNHSNGMAQLSVWTMLAELGIGASLQHYNPIIDEEVSTHWNIPKAWNLIAQMPFGSIESPAQERSFIAREGRFLIKK